MGSFFYKFIIVVAVILGSFYFYQKYGLEKDLTGDVRIKADLVTLTNFWRNNYSGDLRGVCGITDTVDSIAELKLLTDNRIVCADSQDAFVVQAYLAQSEKYACIDSNSKEVNINADITNSKTSCK
mgnify:FL=1